MSRYGYGYNRQQSTAALLKIPTRIVEEALSKLTGTEREGLQEKKELSGFRHFVEVDPYTLTRKQITVLHKVAKEQRGEPQYKAELEFLYTAHRDPSSIVVKNLRELSNSFRQYMADGFIKGWLFERAEYGALTPYLVTKVDYTPSSKYTQEHVSLTINHRTVDGKDNESTRVVYFSTLLNAYRSMNQEAAEKAQEEIDKAAAELDEVEEEEDMTPEQRRKMRKQRDELEAKMRAAMSLQDGVPMERLLLEMDLYKENPELHKAYEKQLERFMRYIKMFGAQMKVRGEGTEIYEDDDDNRRWRWWNARSSQSMLVDGRPSRAILDTRPLQNLDTESSGKKRKHRDEEEAVEDEISVEDLTKDDFFGIKPITECNAFPKVPTTDVGYTVPVHLELKVFHLEKHRFFKLHVVNMAPYKYRKEMKEQLILPDDVMELAEMLIANEVDDAEDIVEGKSQGRLITCIGDPGLGKTLLAEVLSEAVEKPLYKFQAAQLGLDPETLENNLAKLLHRAERWGCVVMIDEANAYIHDRGVDVTQNAIVGVFLRRLEYYRGTIIITTNQTNADGSDMDIDDAILSRSNAVIKFELPTSSMAKKIWRTQSTLLKAKISDEVINQAVNRFAFSGRSIRQLLRLTWSLMRSRKQSEVTLDSLVAASKFIAVSRKERREQALKTQKKEAA